MKIHQKMLLSTLLCVALSTAVFGTLSYRTASQQAYTSIDDEITNAQATVISNLKTINALMRERVTNSMIYFKTLTDNLGEARQTTLSPLNQTQVADIEIGGISQLEQYSLVDEVVRVMGGTATLFSLHDGEFTRISTNVITDNGRAIGTQLFKGNQVYENIMDNKDFIGQVDILGAPYITYYSPLTDPSGNLIGILYTGYKAKMERLNAIISEQRILNEGFFALIDGKGNIQQHSKHIDTSTLQTLLSQATTTHTLHTFPFEEWGYKLVVGVSNEEVANLVFWTAFENVLQVVCIGMFFIVSVWLVTHYVVRRPLNIFIETLTCILSREGDLKNKVPVVSSDEIGEMGSQFNQLLDKVRFTIIDIKSQSDCLVDLTNELTNASSLTNSLSDHIKSEAFQFAAGVEQMHIASNSVSENAVTAESATKEARNLAAESMTALKKTIELTVQQEKTLDDSVSEVQKLHQSSTDIYSIVETIKTIAEQTNLLALNAAIEAARAGDAGRGFAVVADEVRELATRTQQSTQEINTMIQNLHDGTENVSKKIEENKSLALKNVDSVKNVAVAVENALIKVEQISVLNEGNSSASTQQSEVANELSSRISSITNVGKENTLCAQTVTKLSDKLTELMGNINNNLMKYSV